MGIGLPDENAHACNEKLDLDNLDRGMLSAGTEENQLATGRRPRAVTTRRLGNWATRQLGKDEGPVPGSRPKKERRVS